MKVHGLLRFTETAENKREFKRTPIGLHQLAGGDKCHIDLHMIESRARLLEQFGAIFTTMGDDGCEQYILAEEIAKVTDKLVLRRQRLCQVLVDSRRRLAFVVHHPMSANPTQLARVRGMGRFGQLGSSGGGVGVPRPARSPTGTVRYGSARGRPGEVGLGIARADFWYLEY